MTITNSIAGLVREPLAWFGGLLATFGGYLGYLDPLLQFVASTSSTWWPLAAVGWRASALVEWIPVAFAEDLFLVATGVYGLLLVWRWAGKARDTFNL